MKNKFFIILAILAVAFCPIGLKRSATAKADEKTIDNGNFTNLIVFAKFNGESEFIDDIYGNGTSVLKVTDNSYNKANYSVKDYYLKVSNGKLNLNNVYLFTNDGSITLSRERGYYCKKSEDNPIGYESSEYYTRMSELKQDWGNAIACAINDGCRITNAERSENYDLSELDKNNDGYIDSITIIYKYSYKYSVGSGDCLWNYQTYSNYIELTQGKKTLKSNAYLQVTANYDYLYSDEDGNEFAILKTLVHETGHIFGLKDLYKTENNSPVYYLSAMAKALSPVPQYITAKEREVLGWLDENNVAYAEKSGTYTINVTSSEKSNGIICYKKEIPEINKTLYLEYRKFDGTVNKYDSQQKDVYKQNGEKCIGITIKSGLICFLLEKGTTFPNNLYSSSNNWNYQALGGQFSTKNDAALALNESLQITSDISIIVTNLTDEKLTFLLQCNDSSECNHSLKKTDYSAPSCTVKGNIEYYYCSLCDKYFLKNGTEISLNDTVLDFAAHIEMILPETQSTCTNRGLTAGKKCSVCNKILVAQTEKPLLNHTESDWIIDKQPTYQDEGEKHTECVNCNKILQTQIIPKNTYVAPPTPDNSSSEITPPAGNEGDSNNTENGENLPEQPIDPTPNVPNVPNTPDTPSAPSESEKPNTSSDPNESDVPETPNDFESNTNSDSSQNGSNCKSLFAFPPLFSSILFFVIKKIIFKR